jgi:hypothetical protein
VSATAYSVGGADPVPHASATLGGREVTEPMREMTSGGIVIADHVLALAKFESDVGASGEHIERSLSALRNADPVEGTHQGAGN